MVMNRADPDWVTITSYENLPRCPKPRAATRAWLRERGIDWMPFRDNEVRFDLACGPGPDGRWHGWYTIKVRADALRRLGLHPDQPSSIVRGPSPPAWWHAAAERRAR
jgi:hypothetical protein